MRYVRNVICTLVLCLFMPGILEARADSLGEAYEAAGRSAVIAGTSFDKIHRWLHEVALQRVDAETGLYRGNWVWSYSDAAADCFPFLVWGAYVTDLEALNGPVRDMLEAEIRICNHIGRVPATYSFKTVGRWKKGLVTDQPVEDVFFGASEYAKDGLVAIVELLDPQGHGKPYFERLVAIEDDMWARATQDASHGPVPPNNSAQFPGDQLQVLCRLYTMTGDAKYLDWADRIALSYLENEQFAVTNLTDHGCEIIGGLGLWLGVTSERTPERAESYLPKLQRVLDGIVAAGLNPDGFMLTRVAPESGRHEGELSDNWGYNYVAFLCYDVAAGQKRYEPYIREALQSLGKPEYQNRKWGGPIDPKRNVPLVRLDQYADSIEGALYLIDRIPEPAAVAWADREMARNVVFADQPDKLWGTTKFDSNGVRTVVMHAMMHSGGILARPWQQGLRVGAQAVEDSLAIVVESDAAWEGKLCFDKPRHRLFMGFRHDWPRMNTVPEWYVVEPERQYTLAREGTDRKQRLRGQELIDGLPLNVHPGDTLRLFLCPAVVDE